jgi:hypothetical protein
MTWGGGDIPPINLQGNILFGQALISTNFILVAKVFNMVNLKQNFKWAPQGRVHRPYKTPFGEHCL